MDNWELNRLQALKDYQILDTEAESQYDNLVQLAAYICRTPIALISFIDEDRQWIKAKVGLDINETSRKEAFCNYTIRNKVIFEVSNAQQDERFANLPAVVNSPFVHYYAGHPLTTPEGENIGALCVIDSKAHQLNEHQKAALKILADQVISNLEVAKKKRELEKLLKEAREYENLFNNSNEIHCITDADGTIRYINESVQELLGYSIPETLGRNIWDFCTPGERDKVMPRLYEEIAKGSNHFEAETRVLTKDGRIRWFEWADVMIEGKWLVNGRDVTARKENEIKLKTLSIAVEKSTAGVIIRNSRDEVEWMNEAAQSIIGYSLDDLKEKKFGNMLVGEKTNPEILKKSQTALSEKRSYEIEIVLYKKGGIPAWLFISNNPIFNELGEMERQIGIVIDITQRKLAEEQLIKTREDAINLSKAKENFLSVMSHEMRTPLNNRHDTYS